MKEQLSQDRPNRVRTNEWRQNSRHGLHKTRSYHHVTRCSSHDWWGCTFIKGIAARLNSADTSDVLARGWFGMAHETTVWTPPVAARTGGTLAAAHRWWWLPGASALLLGGAILGVARWYRRHGDQGGDSR